MYKIIQDENYNPFFITGVPVGKRFTDIGVEIQVDKELTEDFLEFLYKTWKMKGLKPLSNDKRAGFSKPGLLVDKRNRNVIIYFEYKDCKQAETTVRNYLISSIFYDLTKEAIDEYNKLKF